MFAGIAEAVAREQHKDRLRRFEEANRVQQVESKNNQSSLWQTVRGWLNPVTSSQQSTVRGEAKLA